MELGNFRHWGHRLVDYIGDYLETIRQYPVKSVVQPGDIGSRLPASPPDQGEDMSEIIRDVDQIIMPGITHWQHPGWFAYFPANNSVPSILAEFLTAGIGAQCMSWQTSPAAAELEDRVVEWLRQLLDLPNGMVGVIQDSASSSTLCAIISAREKYSGFGINHTGVNRRFVVYSSEEAHSSVTKAVRIAGLGSDNLRLIGTDDSFAMRPDLLEQAIKADIEAGLTPLCVVATVGTTSSTAIDPLPAIGDICKRYDLWFHIDAAFAGSAAILPEKRYLLDGVEYCDSLVFNPHKWLLTNFDCSVYFVRDAGVLIRTFEIQPEYLKTGVDAVVKNYRDWGVQLGRRFRALKLWFVIRSYGREGLQKMIREHLRLAGLFAGWIDQHPRFERLAPVSVSLVCFRYNDGSDEERLNVLNRELLERINASGRCFLTHTLLRGRFTLRMVIGQWMTTEEDVRAVWDLLTT